MLSAVTGLVLAKLQGRKPYIDWRDGMYVPKGENLYPLLFDAGWMGEVERFDQATDVAPEIWSGRLSQHPTDIIHRHYPGAHRNPLIYRKLSVPLAALGPDTEVAVFWSYISKLQKLRREMAGHPEFEGKSLEAVTNVLLSRYFAPVPEVSTEIERIFSEARGKVIGVHIRYTDRKAPLPKILAALQAAKRAEPEAAIFLATDSREAQDTVLDAFPETIINDKALLSENKPLHTISTSYENPIAEARNALVDMVALSRCDRLIHSSNSTFSNTAASMGGIPSSHQIDVEKHNLKLLAKHWIQARI